MKFARQNPRWSCGLFQGELAKVGYPIDDCTVGNHLNSDGIELPPQRRRTGYWAAFLEAPWDVMAAMDFAAVEA